MRDRSFHPLPFPSLAQQNQIMILTRSVCKFVGKKSCLHSIWDFQRRENRASVITVRSILAAWRLEALAS